MSFRDRQRRTVVLERTEMFKPRGDQNVWRVAVETALRDPPLHDVYRAEQTSTAMTTSAPMARQRDTGTGLTTLPSTPR